MADHTQDLQAELISVFRQEIVDVLDDLDHLVEDLRSGGGADITDTLAAALRILHNIKGAARAAGQTSAESVAHAVEEALIACRSSGEPPSELVLDAMSDAIVVFGRIADSRDVTEHAATLVERLRGTAAEAGSGASSAKDLGAATLGSEEATAPIATDSPSAEASEEGPAEDSGPRQATSVRVDIERLDGLMAYTGDLFSTEARLGERGAMLSEVADLLRHVRKTLSLDGRQRTADVMKRLDRVLWVDQQEQLRFRYLTDSLSAAMKRIRMLPLSDVAPQWRRIVRDCAQDLGKKVQLSVEVGDIEIDKHILDSLRDPLMHVLRNAVDHGVEEPNERLAKGKPASGRVRVAANVVGTKVRIEVSDDGRGLDTKRIATVALDKGLVTSERMESMRASEIHDLLFAPGFSTAKRVSRVSGRGVGMDVVRKRVEELGGTVALDEEPSLGGTTISMTVPSTLVSTRGLLVRSASTVYAFPIEFVRRTVRIEAKRVERVDGASAVRITDDVPVRLHWLSHLMGGRREPDPSKLTILIVTHMGQQQGLVIDEVVGEEEFVSRSLPWNLHHIAGVSGSMILGDGSLAVVVDVPQLIACAALEMGQTEIAGPVQRSQKARPRVLVVDDSLTSRTLNKHILQSAGYEVILACDGEEAWDSLRASSFDLLVSDVQMPRLNGFDLTRRVRGHANLSSLPVVLVTNLDRPDDVAEGAAAGADEYIVKGQFDQKKLIETVARLL